MFNYPATSFDDGSVRMPAESANAAQYDYTRSNTKKIMRITRAKTESVTHRLKGLRAAFRRWKRQYDGLTWSESAIQFIYALSHSGITVATIIYCVVMMVVVGSTMWANYAQRNNAFLGRYALVGLDCLLGILSLSFNVLPAVLVFDYVIGCSGIGFTISCSWQINSGINPSDNATLIVYALTMLMLLPFRIFWWHRYHPNQYAALEIYSGLAQQGLIRKLSFEDDGDAEDEPQPGTEEIAVAPDEEEELERERERESMFTYQ